MCKYKTLGHKLTELATYLRNHSSSELRHYCPVIVGGLFLGPANHGDIVKVSMNPIEDLATQVNLALEESVKRVFDILDSSTKWGQLLRKVA